MSPRPASEAVDGAPLGLEPLQPLRPHFARITNLQTFNGIQNSRAQSHLLRLHHGRWTSNDDVLQLPTEGLVSRSSRNATEFICAMACNNNSAMANDMMPARLQFD